MSGAYLLEVNLCLTVVILFYKMALQSLTFFTANRWYLLLGLIFCIVAPALSIPLLPYEVNAQFVAPFIPECTLAGYIPGQREPYSWDMLVKILWTIYGCITCWHLFKILADLYAVICLIRKYPLRKLGNATLVFTKGEIPASSFLNYILIPSNLRDRESVRACIAHELVHGRQGHSADWLLVRFVTAFCWFNPIMRFWRESVTANHEFIADEHTANQAGRFRYTNLLLNLASSTQISTLHYFSYYGQIKSRIIMLHQTPSRAVNRLRFLAIVPLAVSMLFLFSCETPADQTSRISAYINKDLIGMWENMNRITINDDDGKTPRDFPERSGNVKVCLSNLELRADGYFDMHDTNHTSNLTGTWQSNRAGNAIQLFCNNEKTGASVIFLELESDGNGSIGAWQHYAADEKLSAGHVFYEYKKL